MNGIYINITDQNLENDRLRFNGLNMNAFCLEHTPQHILDRRNLTQQIFYRRYAINYDNTSNMSYEEFCFKYSVEKFPFK